MGLYDPSFNYGGGGFSWNKALGALGAGMQAFGKGSTGGQSALSFGSAPNISGSQISMYGQGGSQIQSPPEDQYSAVLAQALNALIGKSLG